jgi:hypothetical protein
MTSSTHEARRWYHVPAGVERTARLQPRAGAMIEFWFEQ